MVKILCYFRIQAISALFVEFPEWLFSIGSCFITNAVERLMNFVFSIKLRVKPSCSSLISSDYFAYYSARLFIHLKCHYIYILFG